MPTAYEALLAISAYPIPDRVIRSITAKRGVATEDPASESVQASAPFRLAKADLYIWLYFAPNVSQGGQSYSFTDEQRKWWWKQALAIYEELGDPEADALRSQYGYMGSKF